MLNADDDGQWSQQRHHLEENEDDYEDDDEDDFRLVAASPAAPSRAPVSCVAFSRGQVRGPFGKCADHLSTRRNSPSSTMP